MSAVQAGPISPPLVALLNRALAAEEAGALENALYDFRELASAQPDNPRWPFEAVRLLLKLGRNEEASAAFRAAGIRWPHAMADEHLRALVPGAELSEENTRRALDIHCPTDAELKRAVIVDDEAADFQVIQGGRDVAVLVFTGLADRLIMPVALFDRYLAALDVTGVYLRDRRRLAYLQGIKGLGEDYQSTIEALKAKLSERGVREIHTLGNSAGGIGALSYGLDLGAASVLGFATPCDISDNADAWDLRAPLFAQRLRKATPWSQRDFRSRIEAADPRPRIDLWFGAEAEDDKRHALTLDGVAGVHLHPVAGLGGHGALFALAQQGGLSAALAERLGG